MKEYLDLFQMKNPFLTTDIEMQLMDFLIFLFFYKISTIWSNLLPNILSAIKKNINKNFANFSFFELGPVFLGKEPNKQFDNICVIRSGKVNEKSWIDSERNFDFFDVKADLSSVLNCLDMDINNLEILRQSKPYYHPGKSGSLSLHHFWE